MVQEWRELLIAPLRNRVGYRSDIEHQAIQQNDELATELTVTEATKATSVDGKEPVLDSIACSRQRWMVVPPPIFHSYGLIRPAILATLLLSSGLIQFRPDGSSVSTRQYANYFQLWLVFYS